MPLELTIGKTINISSILTERADMFDLGPFLCADDRICINIITVGCSRRMQVL